MEARAIQRTVRQSARKMRLVIDQIRARAVPEAYAILRFSKKHAPRQIHNAQRNNVALDVDGLRVGYAVVNEGPTLKRFTMGAMGRGMPILKRTSHVEIHVSAPDVVTAPAPKPAVKPSGKSKETPAAEKPAAKPKAKAASATKGKAKSKTKGRSK